MGSGGTHLLWSPGSNFDPRLHRESALRFLAGRMKEKLHTLCLYTRDLPYLVTLAPDSRLQAFIQKHTWVLYGQVARSISIG